MIEKKDVYGRKMRNYSYVYEMEYETYLIFWNIDQLYWNQS